MIASLFALSLAVAPAFADPVVGDCATIDQQIALASERVEMMADRYESIMQASEREESLREAAQRHIRLAQRMQAHADELRGQLDDVVASTRVVRELAELERLIEEQIMSAEELMQVIQITPREIGAAERALESAEQALEVVMHAAAACAG